LQQFANSTFNVEVFDAAIPPAYTALVPLGATLPKFAQSAIAAGAYEHIPPAYTVVPVPAMPPRFLHLAMDATGLLEADAAIPPALEPPLMLPWFSQSAIIVSAFMQLAIPDATAPDTVA
jgi:hypothetical protein